MAVLTNERVENLRSKAMACYQHVAFRDDIINLADTIAALTAERDALKTEVVRLTAERMMDKYAPLLERLAK